MCVTATINTSNVRLPIQAEEDEDEGGWGGGEGDDGVSMV